MTSPFQLQRAARCLLNGGIIAYPTEGVYGLGCIPDDREAVHRLLEIKGRSAKAGLILIAPDYEFLAEWISPTRSERSHLLTPMEHPVTWVVTAGEFTPAWLTGGRTTLAVRISAHPVVGALCIAADSALVSTSANHSGHRAAKTALQVRHWLGRELDCVVSGALGGAGGASEIRSALDGRVIRPKMTTARA